jgi:WD40 repeat protein
MMRISTQPSITSLAWTEASSPLSPTSSALGLPSAAGTLFSGSLDGVLRTWKYQEKRCAAKVKLPGGPITCLREYSRFLAVGHSGGDLSLVTQEDGQLLRVAHEAHSRKVTAIRVAGHKMFTASHDSSIKVREPQPAKDASPLWTHVPFTPHGIPP